MASDSEDELSSPLFNAAQPDARQSSDFENTTPIDNLRRLAAVSQQALRDARTPSSPTRPASSIPSSIGSRLADRTTASIQNGRSLSRPLGRRPVAQRTAGAPTTPHAIRALEERRRVAMTPSRERRRASGRGLERGSPFNILRALSQVATAPVPVQQTIPEDDEDDRSASPESAEQSPPSINDSDSSDEVAKPPRISLSANEMRIDDDDDTGVLRPPEISRLEDDEDLTVRSIEGGRRAEIDTTILRRGRVSEFFGPLGLGNVLEEDLGQKRPGSPSFVIGDQSLFAGLGADEETVDLPELELAQNAASPLVGVRDIELADSTFRFDIPQDVTEEVVEEEDLDEDEMEGQVAIAADTIIGATAYNEDDDDAPEDFGSQSASDLEEDAADVAAEEPGSDQFLNVAGEDYFVDAGDPDGNREVADVTEIGRQAVSRELEDEYGAKEAAAQSQMRPFVLSKSEVPAEASEASEDAELEGVEQQEVIIPQLAPSRVAPKPVTKPATRTISRAPRAPKPVITSKHGQKVPSLPAGVVKAVADSFLQHSGKTSKKTKKDTVAALMQATDWFFEQVSEDLDAYSKHADRDTIEEADVVALMRRQRVLATGAKNVQGNRSAALGSSRATLFSLAQRFLPRELITELRMEPPPDERRKKRRRISEGGEYD